MKKRFYSKKNLLVLFFQNFIDITFLTGFYLTQNVLETWYISFKFFHILEFFVIISQKIHYFVIFLIFKSDLITSFIFRFERLKNFQFFNRKVAPHGATYRHMAQCGATWCHKKIWQIVTQCGAK